MGRMDGKVALVTGAGRGMGEATARLFVAEGARVALTDISQGAHAIANELGGQAIFVQHDVGDEDAWTNAVARVTEAFGGLDVLVNNAGILRSGVPLADETVAAYERVLRVNVIGAFLGIRTAVPELRKRGGGAIVNLSSNAGLMGVPTYGAYSSSKWAVRGLSQSAALELASDNIRVNAVMPGLIDTPMNAAMGLVRGQGNAPRVPLGRVGVPEDIAAAVLFLASDESAFISGAEIIVDGGSKAGPTQSL